MIAAQLSIGMHTSAKENDSFRTILSDTVQTKLSFVIDSLCIVSDPEHILDTFFSELDQLSMGKDTVISIIHLGDSHIQAGFLSGRIMRLMQQQYGNAGRGWIAPFKISKTNEPDDYFINSLVKDWTTGRSTQHVPKTPIGPGGIGIHTVSPFVNFDIIIAPNNGAGYEFNQAVLYRGKESMPMLPSGISKDFVDVYDGIPTYSNLITDTFRVSYQTDSLQLQSTRRKEGTDLLIPAEEFDNLYYGFNLTNGSSGILYHSIGLNGAMFVNYTDDNFVSQLSLLQPSLLVISLGTNESFGRNFTIGEFTGQVESFLSLVRKHLPNTAILLTTPPECYKRVWVNKKRTYVRNQNTELVARALRNVAKQKGLACWDLYEATGGKNSSKNWFDGKWMGRDRIHFNKDGYKEQGTLFLKALMNLKIKREENNNNL